jgi:hypothetical protein
MQGKPGLPAAGAGSAENCRTIRAPAVPVLRQLRRFGSALCLGALAASSLASETC